MQNETSRLSSLAETVEHALQDYLDALDGHEPTNIYRLVLDEVERTLLEAMMSYAHGNQSKAAQYMGINRVTLRTKLKRYDLI